MLLKLNQKYEHIKSQSFTISLPSQVMVFLISSQMKMLDSVCGYLVILPNKPAKTRS